ncbi:MAG: hypothetical protein AB8B65_20935 [Kordia sp.]|uniref:hypothetical protein n=1 Tax=Kordia sp. TaxID=1965332 RepID=UPI00385A57B1
MKFILYIIVICCLLSCESNVKEVTKTEATETQNTITIDTTRIVEKAMEKLPVIAPKGSQVFTESVKLRYLRYDGYWLKKIEVPDCEESGDGTQDPNDDKKIKSIKYTDDGFLITFTVVENCCSEFLCEAELVNKSTLNIIYQSFGRECSCNCKFTLSYDFEVNDLREQIGEKRIPITHIQFNNEPTSKVAFKKY